MEANTEPTPDRWISRALAIVEALPTGRSIDDQTLMAEAAEVGGHFDARNATILYDRLLERPELELIDTSERSDQIHNVHYFVRKPR